MVSIKLSISYICYFISKAKLGGISIHSKLNVAVNTTSSLKEETVQRPDDEIIFQEQ